MQLWDMRRPDRVEKQFTAHGGPIFALDWHPEVKTWIATAGRDKTIKVGTRKELESDRIMIIFFEIIYFFLLCSEINDCRKEETIDAYQNLLD